MSVLTQPNFAFHTDKPNSVLASRRESFVRCFVLLFCFALLVLRTSSSLAADLLKYKIEVDTANEDWAETWMWPKVILHGDKGKTGWINLQGHPFDKGETDTTERVIDDIGVVHTVYVSIAAQHLTDTSPDWKIDAIRVMRPNAGTTPTTSEFVIGKWLWRDESTYYKYTNPKVSGRPAVEVSQSGLPVVRTKKVLVANYDENYTDITQTVMKFKESWSFVDAVAITQGTANTFGAAATVGYTSPETIVGQFDASVTASWEKTIDSSRTTSQERISQSEFDWAYDAPANSVVFRRVKFRVSEEYTMYVQSNGGDARWIRKVGSPISSIGASYFVQLSASAPKPWSVIEREILPHMDSETRNEVRGKRAQWEAAGFIVPEGGQGVGGGQPVPQSSLLPLNQEIRILSMYRRNYYLRSMPNGAKIAEDDGTSQFQDESVFIVRPGLSGEGVSLESKKYSGQFLRHSYNRLKLSPRAELQGFYAKDGSFHVRSALNGQQGGFSLEAVNFPGRFLRHSYLVMKLGENDASSGFAVDASFLMRQPTRRQQGSVDPPSTNNLSGTYRIQVVGNGLNLHVDGLGDNLVSTRSSESGQWTRFKLERQSDGNYRIKMLANSRYVRVDRQGDRKASTRPTANNDSTKFQIEPQSDGTYRIRLAVDGGRYLHVFGRRPDGDNVLSTRFAVGADNMFSRFRLIAN